MATITKGKTFGTTEQVTAAKLHTMVDSAVVSDIVNADISDTAAIAESKVNFDETSGHPHDGSSSGGKKVDLSAPNAIGGTTPNAGAFTTLSSSGAATLATVDGVLGSVTPAAITGTVVEAGTSLAITGTGDDGVVATGIKDEDDMASDSATHLATQQSIKSYVDTTHASGISSFLAWGDTAQNNISNSADVTIQCNQEVFDIGSDYNTTTYTFTAPQDGRYLFSFGLRLSAIDTAATYVIKFIASNRTISFSFDPSQHLAADGEHNAAGTALIDMETSDTCLLKIRQTSGTEQTDIVASSSATDLNGMWWSGTLI